MTTRSVFDNFYMGPITPEALRTFEETVLPQALGGDHEALTRVMFICAEAITQGQPLPAGLAAYVSGGLRAMAGEFDFREAWRIQRQRGQKNTALAHQTATKRAFMVEMERANGMTLEKAVELVAEREHASPNTVHDAWKRHHRKVKTREDESMFMFMGTNEKR